MKQIALTQRIVHIKEYNEKRDALDIVLPQLLETIELLPIILPSHYTFEHYVHNLNLEGLFLSGGNDLNSLNPNPLSSHRDDFEIKILQYFLQKDLPVFGLCRGLQLITEHFGGTLKPSINQVAIEHTLIVNPQSKYAQHLNQLKKVNAYHNFELDKLPTDFIVSATDQNGSIKAIEHKDKNIFAQMWHPERKKPFDTNELSLIKEFFS